MAALPPERTMISRPFSISGVDFAGPFDLKSYVGRGCKVTKGYVLVFVCFSTKAIHLELTSAISTNAFLAAFSRFFARRGCPSKMYSDNGTAFIGASNVLSADSNKFLSSVRQDVLSQHISQNIDWHFIPPGAPHMGGIWEAGVKSFKSHLKKISHAQNFTYEEFNTMLIRIESCLNSRPLCPISDDPSELNALTPGHFLVGSPLLAPPEPELPTKSLSLVNRWQKLKLLHHHFALLWKEEYLKELHKRTKWQHPERNFEPTDMTVIRRENFPPSQWQLGRIERVIPGPDSKVRVAQIRTSRAIMSTPPRRLKTNREDPSNSSSTNSSQHHNRQIISAPDQRTFKDCRYCNKEHPLRKCFRFRRLSVNERRKVVRCLGYCYNCLAHSHVVKNCKSRERCKICLDEHHTLLHITTQTHRPRARPLHLAHLQRNHHQDFRHRSQPSKSAHLTTSQPALSSNKSATIVININPK